MWSQQQMSHERSTLPSAKDVIRSYPIRESQADVMGFSLDIKSAHKRIVIKPSEQGLVGFTLDDVPRCSDHAMFSQHALYFLHDRPDPHFLAQM